MNILIILAHPSSLGFSRKVAANYKRGAEESGAKVEVLDLYKTDLKQSFLNFENPKAWPDDKARKPLQEKIAWADQLVFAFPIWWGGAPAILKNFLDMNMTSGFAYRYVHGKPKKLLKGKTARVFVTCDGPPWLYRLSQMPKMIWKMGILGFCGIKLLSFKVYGKADRKKPSSLKGVLKIARG